MANYTTEITLPSLGKFNENIPEGKVTIRALTTADEKKLFGSDDEKVLYQILQDCIEAPADIKYEDLVAADEHFLLIEIRRHTYGDKYTCEITCPKCKQKTKFSIDLKAMAESANYLQDGYEKYLNITLPMSGDQLVLRVLTGKLSEQASGNARQLAKKTGANYREIEYINRIAKMILSVNGKDVDFGQAVSYVNQLHARDTAYIFDRMNHIKMGYDTKVPFKCNLCGYTDDIQMPITSEFFRPEFED